MRRRTPLLLATPAVVAAMAVAVPALAGSSSGSGAHKSTAPKAQTSAKCIVALVGKRRVRECLIAGPRGPRGVRGFLGPNGPRGVQGKTGRPGEAGAAGPIGSQGPAGTARAYALVQPGPSGAGLVPGQTAGIIGIRRPLTGIYCLIPASGIIPTTEAPVASGEASHSGPKVVVPVAVVFAGLPNNCGSGEFEVETYNISGSEPKLSDEVAFTIIVP